MTGLLTGGIAELFGSVFGSLYLDGRIKRMTRTVDGFGDVTEAGTWRPAKIQVDAVTESQRLEEGYSATDVRLVILQANQNCVENGATVEICGATYRLGPTIGRDPANSYFDCRGIRVSS